MLNDLIHLWRFEEESGPIAWDAVRGGAPLDVRGAVRVTGRVGRALCFRNPGDNAIAPGLAPMEKGTASLWLRLDAPKQAGTVLSIHDQMRLNTDKDSGMRLEIQAAKNTLPAPSPLVLGQWTHVAVTFDASGIALYLDGRRVAEDSTRFAGITRFGSPHVLFVALCPLPSNQVSCAVDELAISRRCLGADEIKSLASTAVDIAPSRTDTPVPIEIDAARYIDRTDPACGLQRAIDAAWPNGGRVVIPAGRFVVRRGLVLRSRITLAGAGSQSILAAAPGFESKLARDAKSREATLELADAYGLAAGDAIVVRTTTNGGYNSSHAIVTGVRGNRVELSHPLWNDYAVADGAFAARWFPMLSAIYAHDIRLEDLAIEGRAGQESSTCVDFTTAAIGLERCLACHITRVQIRNWLHDGICLGKGSWHRISECLVRDCKGHGFHPGNRMRKCTWLHNMAIHNGQDGFFFCCGVEENIVAHNIFDGNAWNGIGDLGSCNDERNLVTSNQCLNNGRAGILVNGGKHNTVTNNLCTSNSRSEPGQCAGIQVAKPTHTALVAGNVCVDPQSTPTQRKGIIVEEGCEDSVVRDNVV